MNAPLDLMNRLGQDHLEATRRIGDILIRSAVGIKEAGFDALRSNLSHGIRAAESIAEGDAHGAINRAPDASDAASYLRVMTDLMIRTQTELADAMGDYADACARHLAEGTDGLDPSPMIVGMRQVTDAWRNGLRQVGRMGQAVADGSLVVDATTAASEAVQAAAGAARTAADALATAAGAAVAPAADEPAPAAPVRRAARRRR